MFSHLGVRGQTCIKSWKGALKVERKVAGGCFSCPRDMVTVHSADTMQLRGGLKFADLKFLESNTGGILQYFK